MSSSIKLTSVGAGVEGEVRDLTLGAELGADLGQLEDHGAVILAGTDWDVSAKLKFR